jgi:hypothetical protein
MYTGIHTPAVPLNITHPSNHCDHVPNVFDVSFVRILIWPII